MAEQLTTEEILATCRQQDGEGAVPAAEPSAAEEPATTPPAAPVESSPAESAPPAATPSSTADIMAAARAQAAGKATPATPPSAPGSTADILAAARAQSAGGTPPAAPPTAAPGSTSDILAAARAQATGGTAPSAEKPAAKPAAKKTAAPPGGMTPQEMLAALRAGKKPSELEPGVKSGPVGQKTAVAAKPTLPPTPQKPAKTTAKGKGKTTRRESLVAILMTPFAMAWICLSATTGAATLAVARFMFPNVLVEPPSQFKVGPPGDYPLNSVSTKWKAQFGIWIVNTDGYNGNPMIYALASVCTHLGCTPSWLEGEQKFKCPCHGSGFYITGINFEGPAPRPLERVGLRVAPDGLLEVDKSVKFQEELGQWQDGTSFVG